MLKILLYNRISNRSLKHFINFSGLFFRSVAIQKLFWFKRTNHSFFHLDIYIPKKGSGNFFFRLSYNGGRIMKSDQEKTRALQQQIMFNHTWDLLSHRWKFYIVWLLGGKSMRFGELRRICSAISRVTLTGYLRELEREGFITRTAAGGNALSSLYSLTELARDAQPAVNALMAWGRREEN
jgi:DNA-binding HxlR family transcriptional regulator